MAIPYFSTIGHNCPAQSNPADFFMSMMSIESLEIEDQEEITGEKMDINKKYKEMIENFDQKYQNSDLKNNAD